MAPDHAAIAELAPSTDKEIGFSKPAQTSDLDRSAP